MSESISASTFVVRLANPVDSAPRAARRVAFNADILRSAKVYAGDVVAIAAAVANGSTNTLDVSLQHGFYECPIMLFQ